MLQLGGMALFFFVIAIPIVGLVLHFIIAGQDPMNAELDIWLIYGLAATGAVFLGLFSWNFACSFYRIERDAHRTTTSERDDLLASVASAPKRRSLSKEEQGLLSDALKKEGLSGEINIIFASGSDEAIDYATDIGDALSGAGLDCTVHNGGLFTPDLRDRGVKLFHGTSDAQTERSVVIQRCLEGVGIRSELRPQPEERPDSGSFINIARSNQA